MNHQPHNRSRLQRLFTSAYTLCAAVLLLAAGQQAQAATPAQQAYLKGGTTAAGDNLGYSVAISGDTAVVGMPFEGSGGAAYIYVRSAGVWAQQAKLTASNREANDKFGYSVAITGDTVVIGAPGEASSSTTQGDNSASGAGAVYVFTRTTGTWTQTAYLKALNPGAGDNFGGAVAVSSSGDTVVIGAPWEDGSTPGVNGAINESATDSGAAYVFTLSAGNWTQQAYLKASNPGGAVEDFMAIPPIFTYGDNFGASVAISGNTVVVGAAGESSSTTGVNPTPNELADSAGAAYVFTRSGTTWSQQAFLKASNAGMSDGFGNAVAISGDTVVVGASNEASSSTTQTDNNAFGAGAAYVFTRSVTTWSQQAYLKASNPGSGDNFGSAVAIATDTVVIGAKGEDSSTTGVNSTPDELAKESGAAYVLTRSETTWTQQAYLKASNPGGGVEDFMASPPVIIYGDYFGSAVAISGDTVIVGSLNEDSNATGVNAALTGGTGTQADNSATDSGAAYVFTSFGPPPPANTAPTDIALSASSIAENAGANATVGTLTATDVDAGATHTFTLVTGTGDTDNGAFNISGSSLRLTASANFEVKNSYSVRVQATDNGSLTFAKQLTITVTDVNEAPVVAQAIPNFAVNEDAANVVTNLTLHFSDVETAAASLTYAVVGNTNTALVTASITQGTNLTLAFTANGNGTSRISVSATDAGALAVTNTFVVTVNPVNDAPSFALPAGGVAGTARGVAAGLPDSGSWTSIASSADGMKLAAGDFSGQIYTSVNAGINWTARGVAAGLPADGAFRSIASSTDGMKLAVVTDRQNIYTSVDAGTNWTRRGPSAGVPDSGQWSSIASSADGMKLAAVDFTGVGVVYTSVNAGTNWTAQTAGLPASAFWNCIASSADGTKLAAGSGVPGGGRIYTSVNAGTNWTVQPAGLPASAFWAILASSADGMKLVAVDVDGAPIYTSVDAGTNWTARTTGLPATADWSSIASSEDGTKLAAVGYSSTPNLDPMAPPELRELIVGKFYTSLDSGATWVQQTAGLPTDAKWQSIASSADGMKLAAVADQGKIYTSIGSAGANQTVAADGVARTVPDFATGFSPGPANESEQTLANPGYTVTVQAGKSALFSAAPAIANNGTLTFTPAVGGLGGSAVITVVAQDSGGTANAGVNTSAPQTFTITITPAPPMVASISPNTGSTAGETRVTITGTGFTGATGVTFRGTAATEVVVVNDTTIVCTTPARAVGPASVVVTTPVGTNGANTLYTYAAINVPPSFSLAPPPATPLTGLSSAGAMVFDRVGNLYVANVFHDTVSKFSAASLAGTNSTFSVTGGALPNGLTLNATSGELSGTPTAAGSFDFTLQVAYATLPSAARNVTIVIAVASVAPVMTSFGLPPGGTVGTAYSHTFGPTPTATLTGLNYPNNLAFDGVGNLYVGNVGNDTVSKFSAASLAGLTTGSITPSATLTGVEQPLSLAFDGPGNLYVANHSSVSKFSAASLSALSAGEATPIARLTGLVRPVGLAFDKAGNLYVANGSYHSTTVSKFSAASLAAGDATPIATLTGLKAPSELAFDRSGNLYVSQRFAREWAVYKFSAASLTALTAGSTAPTATLNGLINPLALLVDGANNLYVSDPGSASVSKFEPGATTATAKFTAGVAVPTTLALDGDGTLHVANSGAVARFPDLSVDISVKASSSFSRTQARDIKAGPAEEVAAGQTVSFTVTTDRQNLFSVPPSIDAAGRLTFTTHYLNFVARVTVIARDSAGASSAPQTFKITSTGAVGYDCPLNELFFYLFGVRPQSSQSTSLLGRVMRVAADVTPTLSLATFHALEGVLGESPEGRRLRDLYRAHGPEIVQMIQTQPTLRAQMNTVVTAFQPLVVSLLSGRGQQVQITQTMIDQLNTMWSGMATMASPELLETLNTERARHNGFQDFANRDFSQWAQILQVPAPTNPRVNISNIGRPANGMLSLEANAVEGADLVLWGSPDLINWSPVPGAVRQTDGFTLWLTDPSPSNLRRFYRLQTGP